MQLNILSDAIENNADWCARIWKSQGLDTHKEDGLVYCLSDVPDFYPNIVTTKEKKDETTDHILRLQANSDCHPFFVKDSTAQLELQKAGFVRLFDAKWLWFNKTRKSLGVDIFNFRQIRTEAELDNWEKIWDTRENEGASKIFLPVLLKDNAISFWQGTSNDGAPMGYTAMSSDRVVGLSNIFGDYSAVLSHAVCHFSGKNIVGYETSDMIPQVCELGAHVVGDLIIWMKPE